jgi:hypothetical protein
LGDILCNGRGYVLNCLHVIL